MNSEKVKELKKALECCAKGLCGKKCPRFDKKHININCQDEMNFDVLTYIAELEEYIEGNEQDAKAFVHGWKKDLETELKQFAKAIEVNLLNEFTIDDDVLLSDLEFSGEIIKKVLNDTLKKFGVEVEE